MTLGSIINGAHKKRDWPENADCFYPVIGQLIVDMSTVKTQTSRMKCKSNFLELSDLRTCFSG